MIAKGPRPLPRSRIAAEQGALQNRQAFFLGSPVFSPINNGGLENWPGGAVLLSTREVKLRAVTLK